MKSSIFALLTAALLTVPFTAASAQGGPPRVTAAVADVPGAAPSLDPIRPGDVIRLRVWREPDLSGEFPVDLSGQVTLPKLGAMHVATAPGDSLRAVLVAAYGRFLRQASVDVTVLRRVRVAGAVRTPGLYTVDPTITIGDVLVLAGGATPEGDVRRVRLVRDGARVGGALSRDANLGAVAIRSGDQLEVPERAWASRNVGAIGAIIGSSAFLVSALLRR